MSITHIHSFLVSPGKSDETHSKVPGATVGIGEVPILTKLYRDVHEECNIDIVFEPTDGRQENARRDLFLKYAEAPTLDRGSAIAGELEAVTTHRSGMGLLFLIAGDDKRKRLIMARFPADQGVVADLLGKGKINIEFLERVFMKSAKAYKCVVYGGPLTEGSFWKGKAVDKQIEGPRELSNYWIGDFLKSVFATNAKVGTKRLALALRKALHDATDLETKSQLLSTATLLRGRDGTVVSPDRIAPELHLSDQASNLFRASFQRPELFSESFHFDVEEFDKFVPYRSLELDNGAVLIAEDERFDEIFSREALPDRPDASRFTTTGRIVNENLRRTK
jgi:hypothetical protein